MKMRRPAIRVSDVLEWRRMCEVCASYDICPFVLEQ